MNALTQPRPKTTRDAERPAPSRADRDGRLIGVMMALIGVAVLLGWSRRDALPDPHQGLGYWLGIVGGTAMLVVLVYPLRKHWPGGRWLGSAVGWFRVHMVLGLIGPLIVLFHARFAYSATNSGVALLAMLTVAASGIVGRFLYLHAYRGYSLKKIEARSLRAEVRILRTQIERDGRAGRRVVAQMIHFERWITRSRASLLADLVTLVRGRWRAERIGRRAKRAAAGWLREEMDPAIHGWRDYRRHRRALNRLVDDYLTASRRAGSLMMYSRLLRLWHYFHLPLFLFLVATATIHIIAVHRY